MEEKKIDVYKRNLYNNYIGQNKKRVAAYVRVSTDYREQLLSFNTQYEFYKSYISKRPDWIYVGIYADEGISGLKCENRDQFKQMIFDALAGKIDLIITKSISRFARNTVDSLKYLRLLKENGIGVYFEKENINTLEPIGEFIITVLSCVAQEESRSLSENVKWALRKGYENGIYHVPYKCFTGYNKGTDTPLAVDPEGAKLVRYIFYLYLTGHSRYRIARILDEERFPPPREGDKWCEKTIRCILSNEKYAGNALLQKGYTVDFLTKKKAVNYGELPQYFIKNDHEAIIDQSVFDEVQVVLKERRWKSSYTGFLSRKLRCGVCGGSYGVNKTHENKIYYYFCYNKNINKIPCNNVIVHKTDFYNCLSRAISIRVFNEKGLIDIVASIVDSIVLDPERSEKCINLLLFFDILKLIDISESDLWIMINSITVMPDESLHFNFFDSENISLSFKKEIKTYKKKDKSDFTVKGNVTYLFSDKLNCALCGDKYMHRVQSYKEDRTGLFGCRNRCKNSYECKNEYIKDEEIYQITNEYIKSLIINDKDLLKIICDEIDLIVSEKTMAKAYLSVFHRLPVNPKDELLDILISRIDIYPDRTLKYTMLDGSVYECSFTGMKKRKTKSV